MIFSTIEEIIFDGQNYNISIPIDIIHSLNLFLGKECKLCAYHLEIFQQIIRSPSKFPPYKRPPLLYITPFKLHLNLIYYRIIFRNEHGIFAKLLSIFGSNQIDIIKSSDMLIAPNHGLVELLVDYSKCIVDEEKIVNLLKSEMDGGNILTIDRKVIFQIYPDIDYFKLLMNTSNSDAIFLSYQKKKIVITNLSQIEFLKPYLNINTKNYVLMSADPKFSFILLRFYTEADDLVKINIEKKDEPNSMAKISHEIKDYIDIHASNVIEIERNSKALWQIYGLKSPKITKDQLENMINKLDNVFKCEVLELYGNE